MFKKPVHEQNLDIAISELATELQAAIGSSDEYEVMLARLERLYKVKNQRSSDRVSPDTVATITANLVGIAMILNFERAGAVTSKAIGFVQKLR